MSASFPLSTFEDRVKVLYSYDGARNRLTEIWKDAQNLTVESFNYAYNPGNYLASKGQESFNTGSYGQMTSRTEAGVTTTYAYNPMRMMKEASEAGVTLAKYEYDALGRRIISWLDYEWRTVSLWSGNDSIYEIRQEWTTPPPNPPTETITRYVAVNGQYLAKLVGSYNSTQKFFHHTDIVGTVRAVTDISGAVVARYAYEPFGSLTAASGLVDGELHRFTGKPSDLETDLSYFNARYYDPALGRFTSSDPAKDGLNWYQYCNGNPITFIDLNGMWTFGYSANFVYCQLFRCSVSIGYVIDGHGNVAIFSSIAAGGGISVVAASSQVSITSADTINDLRGIGAEGGVSSSKDLLGLSGMELTLGNLLPGEERWTGVNFNIKNRKLEAMSQMLLDLLPEVLFEGHGEYSYTTLRILTGGKKEDAITNLRRALLSGSSSISITQKQQILKLIGVDINQIIDYFLDME